MPDLKFDGRFFYSANSPSNGHPLLVPVIDNPNFLDSDFKINSAIGIKQLIEGDLGITEQIMNPILKPVIDSVLSNSLISETISNVNNLEKNNPDALRSFLTEQYIPKNIGFKPLEKTIISSMMESHKPLMEFLKIFLELLGVSEDIVSRNLGTYIKVLGKEIGVKSRNPAHWDDSFGYTETITHALKKMLESAELAEKEMDKSMSDKNPLKKSVSASPKNKSNGDTDLPAYYIGYFDEEGNDVEPPKWVKDSNKWFSKNIQDRNGNNVVIGAPFKQLSDILEEGVTELRNRQYKQLESIQSEKEEMLKGINSRLKEAEKIKDEELKKNEIDSLNKERIESTKVLDDLIESLKDVIDGKNIKGNNYIDDNDLSKGINSPAVLNEWVANSRGSQFRMKYYPNQKSTSQNLVDFNGKSKEPYIDIPKFGVNYNGSFYNVEVPLAFDNQLRTEKVYSFSNFYDNRQIEIDDFRIRPYSNKTVVESLNLNPRNDIKPFERDAKTHYSNDITNEYIPDKIKRFFLPLEWEEVFEYNIIQKSTGKVLKVEKEYVPFKIDVENDYELRLIKVVNQALLSTGKNNITDNFFPDNNGEIILIIKNGNLHFLKTNNDVRDFDIKIDYPQQTVSSGTNASPLISNKFSHGTRYVDESIFIDEKYFYLRKNTKWGVENLDIDDSEIYQIKNINKKWLSKNISFNNNILIDNELKTIIFNFDIKIPEYITEYSGYNFKFINNSNNNNTSIKVDSIVYENNKCILKYKGDLNDETINNNVTYEWLESSFVETYQEFMGAAEFKATIVSILDINFIPEPIKNSNSSIIIQGFDKNSLLSTISNRIKKEGNNVTKFTQPNSDADNIYKIIKNEKYITKKGVILNGFKLDYQIPKDFNNKTYSSNIKHGFYYPLRIYTIPQLNNQGSANNKKVIETSTGTIYATNNTIPEKLNLEEPESTLHSTPDINENNSLKEGIIYHGLDPRFVDRNKWKVFYLVEAIKKDNKDNASINKNLKKSRNINSDSNKGKEWYGLIDRVTALPMVITKLVPLIAKIIPLAIKMIQTVSNPKKMSDLLLSIGLLDESISKFPVNFTDFSKKGFVAKEKNISKKKLAKTFDEYDSNKKKNSDRDSNLFYDAPQIGVKNPTPIFLLDGQAVADFGKGAFGKSIFSFGVELKNGEYTKIKKTKNDDNTKTQNLFQTVFNFIKIPFEVIFKIFKWIIDWVKKLLNPTKIPAALSEFLSFKWLLEIIGKDSILSILGIADISSSNIRSDIDKMVDNITGDKAKNALKNTLKKIRGNNLDFVEVLIYDLIKNGNKIGQDIVERPYNKTDDNKNIPIDVNQIPNNTNNITDCGGRDFSISKMFPNPFLGSGADIGYTSCELPIMFLKPLENIASLLTFIQEFLNGFLSMPISILGLEPTITVPKFGKEIPFANIIIEIVEELKSSLTQISHS